MSDFFNRYFTFKKLLKRFEGTFKEPLNRKIL